MREDMKKKGKDGRWKKERESVRCVCSADHHDMGCGSKIACKSQYPFAKNERSKRNFVV